MLNNEEYLAVFKIADGFVEKMVELGITSLRPYNSSLNGYYLEYYLDINPSKGKHVLMCEGKPLSSYRERHPGSCWSISDKEVFKFISDMPIIRSTLEGVEEHRKQGLEKEHEEYRVAREKLNSYLEKYSD